MKLKRIAASLTAAACCAGMAAYVPMGGEETFAAEAVYNDFEVNYEGWHGTDKEVQVIAEDGEGYGASRGMKVSCRKTAADGAEASKGFYLFGGVKYSYGVQVYSETDETFHLSLLCLDEETGEETEVELASKKVKAGEWTELSADYKAPANSYEFRLTITTDSTNDFSFDDVLITTEETKVINAVSAASSDVGLKDVFAKYFRVGNILNGGTVRNSGITGMIIKNYNSLECENETKPDATLVQNGSTNTNIKVSLNSAAAIMDFCVKNNIPLRGHALVWHSQTPQWFFKDNFQNGGNWVSSTVMDQRLDSYAKNLFALIEQQYPDLYLYAYDVCNEVVSDDANRTANHGGAREPGYNNGLSPWVQVYGSNAFVEKAFTIARKYAPSDCKLFYNDYNEYWDHKRDAIYNMCKSLYEKGVLDGVGMQSHVNADVNGFSGLQSYTTAMRKYASIGCEVQVTELDVSTENGKFSAQQQADKYKGIFQAAIDVNTGNYGGKVTAVCIWGPNDANTWINSSNAPLLHDGNNQPKAAYNTLMSMVPQSEWGDGDNMDDGPTQTPSGPDENGYYFNSPFETGTDSWASRGGATLATTTQQKFKGNQSLYISGRTAAWNGAQKSLSARDFTPGEEYSFSSNVMYTTGNATDTFYMKLQYVDASGETQYSSIAEATAMKGEWVQLANTNYKIPAGATDMYVYVETAESTIDFYLDEVVGAVAGKKIEGAGESKKVILGDINFDEKIDALDMAAARQGLIKGYSSSAEKLSADVDQSGENDVTDLVLIQSFIMRKITSFPVAERPTEPTQAPTQAPTGNLQNVDTAAMQQIFSSVNIASSWKKDGENNALYTQRFGADPGFMVYKDRLYVFTTNDAFEYDGNGNIKENSYDVGTINCHSSADLVNWTDHGPIPVAGRNGRTQNGAAKWASASWAPDACWKTINGKDKFFLYFANSAGGIGVLTADSPEGPWTDPIGRALVTTSTPNCNDVTWMFDPAVFVDDDGSGYLYFGGGVPSGKQADPGTARCVKLGDDMTSLAGTPVRMNPPYLFEDSSILKIGNTYYYSYCTNFNVPGGTSVNGQSFASGEICYMTSNNPLGPFTFKGRAFKNPSSFGLGGGGNNHHSIVEFKGKYYMLYHARMIEDRMGVSKNYRSPHIDVATVSNGMINVTGSMKGVSQLETLNPYNVVQAETISNQAGINVSGVGNTVISEVDKGDWIKTSGVEFSKGASTLTVRVSSKNGAAIRVTTGSATGDVVGYVNVPSGGNFTEITVPVNNVSGTKDLYFVFSGQLEFDWWSFA